MGSEKKVWQVEGRPSMVVTMKVIVTVVMRWAQRVVGALVHERLFQFDDAPIGPLAVR